jgi:hypothetical protein
MIPSTTGFLDQDFEIETQPSKTYKMNLEGNTTRGYTDGLEAMKQVIFKILNTERYAYVMYSWNYGIETMDLYGEPVSYVCPELERRITEALMQDDRIEGVSDFDFDLSTKGVVHVSFVVNTIFGDVQEERTVNF